MFHLAILLLAQRVGGCARFFAASHRCPADSYITYFRFPGTRIRLCFTLTTRQVLGYVAQLCSSTTTDVLCMSFCSLCETFEVLQVSTGALDADFKV